MGRTSRKGKEKSLITLRELAGFSPHVTENRHNGKVKSFEALMKYGVKNDRKNIGADFCKKVPNLNVDQSTYWHPLATVIGNVILGRILRWYEVLDI